MERHPRVHAGVVEQLVEIALVGSDRQRSLGSLVVDVKHIALLTAELAADF
jgi:hypothetical protein